MKIGDIEFEKFDVGALARREGYRLENMVKLSTTGDRLIITRDLTDALGLEVGSRVDLYRAGNTMWAIKPSEVGCIALRSTAGKAGVNTKSRLCIGARSACREVSAFTKSKKFTAWVDTQAKAIIFVTKGDE